jgi:sRNA-binding carbon storage regulator CsrA
MKYIITTVFLMISHLILAFQNPSINDSLKLKTQIVAIKGSKIRIGIENPKHKTVELILRDDTTQILFYKKISKSEKAAVQKLDLSELEEGDYSLTIFAGKDNFKKRIKIRAGSTIRTLLVE